MLMTSPRKKLRGTWGDAVQLTSRPPLRHVRRRAEPASSVGSLRRASGK